MAPTKKVKAAATAPDVASEDQEPVEPQSSQLYANTLGALTKARDSMLTLEWHEELNDATPQQQRDAARTLLRLENAIMALSNARLAAIAQKMTDSAKALKDATAGIEDAEQTLANITGFLDAAATIVDVVAKIVPLV